MLSEKPWRLEAVLLLALGVLFGLTLELVGGVVLAKVLPQTQRDQNFYNFIMHSLSFHGLALAMVTVFLRRHGVSWSEFLGFRGPRLLYSMALAVVVGLVVLPPALGLNRLSLYLITLSQMTPEMQMPVKILQVSMSVERRAMFAVAAIIFAPLVEETFFRGILYPLIKQHGHPLLALWGTSLIFAAIHSNLMTFIPLTFLALTLVWLYEKTDNLLAPITAHAVFNLANFFLLIYENEITRWWTQMMQSWQG